MMLCWFLGPLLDLPLVNAIKTTIICSSVIQLNIKVQYWKAMILISNSTALRAFKDRDPSSVFRIYSTPIMHESIQIRQVIWTPFPHFNLYWSLEPSDENLDYEHPRWTPRWGINLCNANTINHWYSAIVNKKKTKVSNGCQLLDHLVSLIWCSKYPPPSIRISTGRPCNSMNERHSIQWHFFMPYKLLCKSVG